MDIDGVIADNSHRKHFHTEGNREAFYAPENVYKDKVIFAGYTLWRAFVDNKVSSIQPILLTARRENLREITLSWLHDNGFGYREKELLTRPINDHLTRRHYKWKAEMLKFLNMQETVSMFFDDEEENIKAAKLVIPHAKLFLVK